jgi:hypothetical protein
VTSKKLMEHGGVITADEIATDGQGQTWLSQADQPSVGVVGRS